LAQVPTALLIFLIILVAVLLSVAGVTLVHRRLPVALREQHTGPLSLINGALNVMFGVIVGFTSFLVLVEYSEAQQTVQSEAGNLEEIYRLAEPLPELERDRIRGLATSYARVVVGEEWTRMRQAQTSPRADALVEELRRSIQEGYSTSTGTEQEIFGRELDAMDELDEDRNARLLALHQRLPSILWIALIVLGMAEMGFSCLVGMKSHRIHLLTAGVLATGITLVLLTIAILDRPFGTDFQVQHQPFELLLHEIEGNPG
jgi:Protein of unknown function (DUF4239)